MAGGEDRRKVPAAVNPWVALRESFIAALIGEAVDDLIIPPSPIAPEFQDFSRFADEDDCDE